jgi:hypothetical protein
VPSQVANRRALFTQPFKRAGLSVLVLEFSLALSALQSLARRSRRLSLALSSYVANRRGTLHKSSTAVVSLAAAVKRDLEVTFLMVVTTMLLIQCKC